MTTPLTPADRKLGRIAVELTAAARKGDYLAVAALLAKVPPGWQQVRVFTLVAAAADMDDVLARAGLAEGPALRQAHAAFKQYRRLGTPRGQIPADLVERERLYQRLVKRRQAARRDGQAA